MDKTRLKNFALWAHQELYTQVKAVLGDGADENLAEETAYLWFNRLIAIRYMEVNAYMPANCQVTLDDLRGFSFRREARRALIYLCNQLSVGLPMLFPSINEETEWLLPLTVFDKGNVLDRLLTDIAPEEWKSQVEIVGWLHQYYQTEDKNSAFKDLQKKNMKISGEKLAAVTQLFTPDWIVRYMVDNSLGRLWKEIKTQEKWRYFNLEKVRLMDPCVGSGHILAYAFEQFMDMYREQGITEKAAAVKILRYNLYGLDIDPRACQLSCFTLMMKARQYNPGVLDGRTKPQVFCIQDSRFMTEELIDFVAGSHPEMKSDLMTLGEDFWDAREYGSLVKLRPVALDDLLKQTAKIENTYYRDVISALYAQQVKEKLTPLLLLAKTMTQPYQVVITNPPYMGKSAMAPKLRSYVKRFYPLSNYDLYAAFIEKCGDMLDMNGYQAMITQHSWMFLKSYEKLRMRLLETRTFVHMVHLGTKAFEEISGEVVQTTAWIMKKTERPEAPGTYVRLVDVGRDKERSYLEEQKYGNRKITYIRENSNFFKIPGAPIAYWISEKAVKAFQKKPLGQLAAVTNGLFTCNNKQFLRYWFEIPRNQIFFNCHSKEECIASEKKWYPYNKGGNFRRWYGNQEYVVNFKRFGETVREYRVRSGQSAALPGQQYYFQESLSWSLVSPGKFGIRYYPPGFVFDVAGSSIFPKREEHLYPMLGLLASAPVYELLQVMNPTINYQAGDVRQIPIAEECLGHSTGHAPEDEAAVMFEGALNPSKVKENISVASEIPERLTALVKENIQIAKEDWDSFETSWAFKEHPIITQAKLIKEKTTDSISLERCFENYRQRTISRAKRMAENEEKINQIAEAAYGFSAEKYTAETQESDNLEKCTVDKAGENQEENAGVQGDRNLYADSYLYIADVKREMHALLSYFVGCMFGRFESGCEEASDNVILLTENDILRRITGLMVEFFGRKWLRKNLIYLAQGLSGQKPCDDGAGSVDEPEKVILQYMRRDFYKEHARIYHQCPIYWQVESGAKGGFRALIYAHGYDKNTLPALERTAAESMVQASRKGGRIKLEMDDFMRKLQALCREAPVLDADDGITRNRAKLRSILKP